MNYTFNGTTKRITLPVGATVLNLPDLHARWKDWVLAGNASSLPAFIAVGGDLEVIPLYLLLQNGWKIVPQSANHTLTVSGGILETSDASDPFEDPAGSYKIRIYRQTPGIAIGYNISGTTPPTIEQIAAEVLSQLTEAIIPVDAVKMNGAVILGTGTPDNKWRGNV